jgi:predicted transcriptional regulator
MAPFGEGRPRPAGNSPLRASGESAGRARTAHHRRGALIGNPESPSATTDFAQDTQIQEADALRELHYDTCQTPDWRPAEALSEAQVRRRARGAPCRTGEAAAGTGECAQTRHLVSGPSPASPENIYGM